MTVYRTLLALAIPASLIIAAGAAAPHMAGLPPSLAGLTAYGVWSVLVFGALVSLAFKRGRAFFALLTLAAAYAAYRHFLQHGSPPALAFAVFAALWLFVPANLTALALLRERGVFNRHGFIKLAVLGLEVVCAAWLALPGNTVTLAWLYASPLNIALPVPTPLPQTGIAVIALAFCIGVAAWLASRSTIGMGLASATAAFGFAAHGVTSHAAFDAYLAAGALILAIAVLQDTFRMAFRDEITGLPSRRALEERLAALGQGYAIAMLDVDRFKGLNDNYGHAVGDQVLKMIAARLARVGGGGSAYRYGGEEFTVLFPGRSLDKAIPHLEALREDIAAHRLALRSAQRPPLSQPGRKQRGAGVTGNSVSVTISIGIAEYSARLDTPQAVIQAADEALYRAKNKGRNQLSR